MPKTENAGAIKLAERARKLIAAKQFSYDEQTFDLTISLGLTTMQADDTPSSLFARADKAIYTAKKTGKNNTKTL